MVDRFRRRPNSRDREALQRELARQQRDRREEVVSSSVGLGIFLVLALLLTFAFRLDDIWFPQRPVWWIQLGESLAFFAVVAGIGIVSGLPSKGSWSLTRYFDRDTLRRVSERIDALTAALNGELHVLRCDATDVIAFGDNEDDIDCYAFQVASDRVFFLDDLTACLVEDDDAFPNTSFEVISGADEEESPIAVHCLGKRLRVRRILPTSALPEDLDEEHSGRLDDLIGAAV